MSPLPLQSCDSWMFVKEKPDRKKKNLMEQHQDVHAGKPVNKDSDRITTHKII